MYRKIFTVAVFDAPTIFAKEEHRSRSGVVDPLAALDDLEKKTHAAFLAARCKQISIDVCFGSRGKENPKNTGSYMNRGAFTDPFVAYRLKSVSTYAHGLACVSSRFHP
jgi:hypothetical protein